MHGSPSAILTTRVCISKKICEDDNTVRFSGEEFAD